MNKKHINILLADDDSDDRNFFNDALKELKNDAHLTTVNNGEELMEYLTEHLQQLPDVLFLDINMPKKNGFDCLSEIKHKEKLKHLPVVMFSTSASKDNANQTFEYGAAVYIRKPNEFVQLVKVIHHALNISTEKGFSNLDLKYILNA